jgi:hypothetical protein
LADDAPGSGIDTMPDNPCLRSVQAKPMRAIGETVRPR